MVVGLPSAPAPLSWAPLWRVGSSGPRGPGQGPRDGSLAHRGRRGAEFGLCDQGKGLLSAGVPRRHRHIRLPPGANSRVFCASPHVLFSATPKQGAGCATTCPLCRRGRPGREGQAPCLQPRHRCEAELLLGTPGPTVPKCQSPESPGRLPLAHRSRWLFPWASGGFNPLHFAHGRVLMDSDFFFWVDTPRILVLY